MSTAFSRLKEDIGWRYCLVILGVLQASVIFLAVLLRPISIEPEAGEEEDSASLSLKQQSAYELENEQTRTSLSSAISGDSGVTSLSSSDEDLRNAAVEAKAVMGWGKEEQEVPPSPPSSPVKEELDVEEAGPLGASRPKLLDFSMLKDAAFIWYSLFGLFATLGFFAPQLYIIELSKSRGVEDKMASYMLSVMAVAEIVGRFSIGVVLNRARCKKTHVLLSCVVLLALVLVAFTLVWEFWGLVVCCALYGFFMGTVGSTHIPMLAEEEVVGIQRMPSCVGVYMFIQSFAGLAGPPLGGKSSCFTVSSISMCLYMLMSASSVSPGVLVDLTHNYGAAFYSCAAGMGLSAICLALVGVAKSGACQRRSRKENPEGEEEKISQDSSPVDFLEVDLVEMVPVQQAEVI